MVVLSEHLEGASSSSPTHGHIYDVFLSFRGLDTRNSFTAYLHKALMDANIITFFDNEEIEIGEDLKPELERSIKASRASVIALSKNYANSTWCLDELVLILEQRRISNHIVIPIFYHVEPTHVRKQQSSFRDAMAKHIQMMETETNANIRSKWVQKRDQWKKALREVADLKGMDVNGRQEMKFIDEIFKDIFCRLHISSRFPLPQLIGMDSSIELISSWLKNSSSDTTCILTILGMGGIGKTSLAKYVYGLHYHEFDTSSFIEDINRRCDEKSNGMLDVQKQLYDNISKPCSVQVHDGSIYTSMIEDAVACKKVFLVLDDIGSLKQLDALLGSKGFHPGSKIIITTKDAWLTESCELLKLNGKLFHAKYFLECLSKTESQKLFCMHAFTCNFPNEGYEKLSEMLVKYCEGHPMALKVLAKSLHNRDVTYWEGYIDMLKKENSSPINNILNMSFESLPFKNNKEFFKHIACFFVGMDRDVTLTILEACDIDTRTGIANLIDRFLLSFGKNNEVIMHQLVQEMGRFLVRKESLYKPWERSRVWGQESFKMLKHKEGTISVLGLTLDMKMLEQENLHGSLELKTNALSKMDSLMLLQLNYVQITDSYMNFPEALRWLCMHGFPLKSIPADLPLENLVALDLSYSNIESFGIFYSYPQRLYKGLKLFVGSCSKDKVLLGSLKIVNLSFCEQLRSLGGFDHLPSLERLILRGCIGLRAVCDSIMHCVELVHVDLSYCNKLEKLPRIIDMLKKINTLLLEGCYLGESRIKIRDMESSEMLKATNIGINTESYSSAVVETIPSDLKCFSISFPRYLVTLSLANCNLSIESFPMDFSWLFMLKELCLDVNPIVSIPNCVRSLPKIETLSMDSCNMLTSVKHPPHSIKVLRFRTGFKPLLRNIVFCQVVFPWINFITNWSRFDRLSVENQGVFKMQPMEVVEEKVLRSLGYNLDFLQKRCMPPQSWFAISNESELQMFYEFGIFSTLYWGKEMPYWIADRSTGPSISFTIPSSRNNLTGLNFCYVRVPAFLDERLGFVMKIPPSLPAIIISNITKNLTWIYQHYTDYIDKVDEECLTFVSHWMFGMNEMECGDDISITVREKPCYAVTKECGVSFVYDERETDEEDVLGYYKSWNHIIGRDLTGFQLTTGEYFLRKSRFWPPDKFYINRIVDIDNLNHLCGKDARLKDEKVHFRAFA